METIFDLFVSDENGSTAVDWLVLITGVMALSFAVMSTLGKENTVLASETSGPQTYVVANGSQS